MGVILFLSLFGLAGWLALQIIKPFWKMGVKVAERYVDWKDGNDWK